MRTAAVVPIVENGATRCGAGQLPAMLCSAVMGVVLVVDDDADLNRGIKRALQSAGYEVVTAMNGREAMTLLRDGLRPSVMLLDLVMPVMNGWEVLDLFARNRELQKIPVILTSAQFGEQFVSDPYTTLRKPFSLPLLLELVDHHCRERAESENDASEREK